MLANVQQAFDVSSDAEGDGDNESIFSCAADPGVGTVSRRVVEVPGASSPESKEVRNVFMIFPG